MKWPRFAVAWLMILVALAAIDFGAIRALYGLQNGLNNNLIDVSCLGSLPMMNILAVGLLVGLRHPATRRFLLGFEAFGMVALTFFIALTFLHTDDLVRPYLFLLLNPLRGMVRQTGPSTVIPIVYGSVAVLWLGWPQVACGLIGGTLAHKYVPRPTSPNP